MENPRKLTPLCQNKLALAAFKSMKHYQSITKWNSLREDLLTPPSQIKAGYFRLYPSLSTNGKFLLDMGEHLTDVGDLNNAVKVLEESKKYYLSYRTFISTADAYYQSGNIPGSIKNLEALSNLVPYKFYPRFELVKLYYQSGEVIKGEQMARFILSMPIKKMSAEVGWIKIETRKLLNEGGYN